MVTVTNIIERKNLEEAVSKTSRLESIGIIAGGIGCDFNNMITLILAYISMVKMQTRDDAPIFDKLSKAEKAALHAKDLVQQLLTLSKEGAPVKENSSILDIIKYSSHFALRGSDVKCRFDISNGLWNVEVDKGQMSLVFYNLLINSRQAMPEGGIVKVRADNLVTEGGVREYGLRLQSGKHIVITIQDYGIGIPENLLKKIFDPYFASRQKGNGLGLAASYSIISKHKGAITVESKMGVGTSFNIYLPASDKDTLERIVDLKEDTTNINE